MKINRGKIITITSSKGGIGKTIFTLNLSGVLADLNKKVLIVDLDLYTGGIALSLNLEKGKTIYNLVEDILNNGYKDGENYISHYNENIDVLPACIDPRQAKRIESKFIDQILTIYSNKYDFILVDTSHILLDSNIVAMDKSDEIIYMISNDPMDLKNTKSMMKIFKDIELTNIKILLNESFSLDKGYFNKFEIKRIIDKNIDYVLERNLYIKNVDKYIIDGEIIIKNKELKNNLRKGYDRIKLIARSLIGDNDE